MNVRAPLVLCLTLALGGCGAAGTCSLATCPGGCCAANGQCTAGTSTDSCGALGNGCLTCVGGGTCRDGACISGADAGSDAGIRDAGTGDGGMGCSCSLPDATTKCSGAGCEIDACLPGFRDFDGLPSNGCEASCQSRPVTASGALDLELKVAQLSGRLTLDGQTFPFGTPRGELVFALAGGGSVTTALSSTAEATYAVELFEGNYRVTYQRNTGCASGPPCGSYLLQGSAPVAASGALDFDLKRQTPDGGTGNRVTISGRVLSSGQTLGGTGFSRGRVRFIRGTSSVEAPLSSTGEATYSIELPSGIYSVELDGAPGCTATSGPLPCYPHRVRTDLPVTLSGALDLDVKIVSLSGEITADGSPLPAGVRPALRLRDRNESGPAVSLAASGPATYSALLYAGAFDLALLKPVGCGLGALPCQSRELKRDLMVTASGGADFDLKIVQVTGQLKANGNPLGPTLTGATRGTLFFADGFDRAAAPLGTSGPATFQLALYAGSYDVWVENAVDCPDGPLPCLSHRVQQGLNLTASGGLDLNVSVAALSGSVTARGQQIANSPSLRDRGELTFRPNDAEAGGVTVPLPPSGAATFAVSLYAGSYQVVFDNALDCVVGPLPCQSWVLNPALQISGSSSRGLDLPVVELSGVVKVDGQPMGPSATGAARGLLAFTALTDNSRASATLGTSGVATYQLRIFPGMYRVEIENAADCPAASTSPVPCQAATLETSRTVSTSRALDLDVRTATLSGQLRVNGAAMPNSALGRSRGVLSFAAANSSSPARAAIAAAGVATYSVRLIHGSYDIGFDNSTDCPAGAVPCQAVVIEGCRSK